MTDKQIIIDGVDVSGCEYYDKNKPLLTCVCEEYPCSECHSCYYKQLKRKEQECEKLKHKIFRYEELLKHSAMAQNTYTAEEVNIIASGIKFVGKSLIVEENIKLHKTLTEIKEIATCCIEGDVAIIRMKQILQKISEVENEEPVLFQGKWID